MPIVFVDSLNTMNNDNNKFVNQWRNPRMLQNMNGWSFPLTAHPNYVHSVHHTEQILVIVLTSLLLTHLVVPTVKMRTYSLLRTVRFPTTFTKQCNGKSEHSSKVKGGSALRSCIVHVGYYTTVLFKHLKSLSCIHFRLFKHCTEFYPTSPQGLLSTFTLWWIEPMVTNPSGLDS